MHAADLELPEWTQWANWPPSTLASHEGDCCVTARAWFRAMSRSLWTGYGGPTWISHRYPWGPSRWPLHWCAAIEAEELDCGAHQALTIEAFRERGIRAVPVQIIQRQESHNLDHFHGRWEEGGSSPAWAGHGAAYHEAVATVVDERAEVWDATGNAWLSPENSHGVYSIAAIRIGGPVPTGETLSWRGLEVPFGEWVSPGRLARMKNSAALRG